jgi:hypothetical protein
VAGAVPELAKVNVEPVCALLDEAVDRATVPILPRDAPEIISKEAPSQKPVGHEFHSLTQVVAEPETQRTADW